MRDLSTERMVAAELLGKLVCVRMTESVEGNFRAARALLEAGRPSTEYGYVPGQEAYIFLAGDACDEDARALTQNYTQPDVTEWDAVIHVFNSDPPRAVCRLIRGLSHWDLERFDLGPFVFSIGDKVVAVIVEEKELEEEED